MAAAGTGAAGAGAGSTGCGPRPRVRPGDDHRPLAPRRRRPVTRRGLGGDLRPVARRPGPAWPAARRPPRRRRRSRPRWPPRPPSGRPPAPWPGGPARPARPRGPGARRSWTRTACARATAPAGRSTAAGTSAATRPGTARYSRSRARQAGQWRRCGRSEARSADPASPSATADRIGASRSHSAPGLDAGQALDERAPALGQAAVDLRVRPAGELADLAVGVALGAQAQAAHLLRLEPAQRLGALAQPLEPLGALLGVGGVDARDLDPLGRAAGQHAVLAPPDGQRLVLDGGAQPAAEVVVAAGGLVGQQDLRGALVGVLGVLGVGRVAPRGGQHLPAEPLEQAQLVGVDPRPDPSCPHPRPLSFALPPVLPYESRRRPELAPARVREVSGPRVTGGLAPIHLGGLPGSTGRDLRPRP